MDIYNSLVFWLVATTAISWLFSYLLWWDKENLKKELIILQKNITRVEGKIPAPESPQSLPGNARPRIPRDDEFDAW
ncbi:hypothetical protein LX87_04085 [Larkinella arboricola]|uniref:Uncharacterized protein n=1 Tax=Larkinella arboricola TaxID=643671 RepID=A0A327WQL1_LARAB|nr:hypothetical protein LX87_04085 [Larkinella arboricola]